MADKSIGHGTVLAGRFRLEDLVTETDGAKFWRATDLILARSVAVNVVDSADPRSEGLLSAARTSATVTDGHFLRVLDAAEEDGVVYVVHEWGNGVSLDKMLLEGPLPPRRAAWLVKEVADAITTAHTHGIAHGRLIPENVMVTEAGAVKLIGFVVDRVLHGRQEPVAEGEPPLSDHESDVHNLAALLYATLAGRWPGTEGSRIPQAPRDHGRIMRPRQVRAGVPRPLDTICDRVLNAGSDSAIPLESAHEISAALSDYIGDPVSASQASYEPTSVIDRDELARFRPQTDEEARTGRFAVSADDAGGGTDDPEATRAVPRPGAAGAAAGGAASGAAAAGAGDLDATQAGAPLFFDDDTGVGWVGGDSRGLRSDEDDRAGDEPGRGSGRATPPPPPPLEEPEARPLFAPGPPRAAATRRDPAPDEPVAPVLGMHSTHGTGSLPPVWGPDAAEPEPDRGWEERDSSREWLKLAAIVAACLLLVLAIVVAFNLGRGSGGSGTEAGPEASPSASPTGPSKPLQIASVSDFDPLASPAEENPEQALLAIDGDPSTSWQTSTYYGNPRLGLLKDGVGLMVDLGSASTVSDVAVTLEGKPTDVELLAAGPEADEPTDVTGLDEVASQQGVGGRVDLSPNRPVTTRYLVVWLTSLPPADDGFRGEVAEIVVRP